MHGQIYIAMTRVKLKLTIVSDVAEYIVVSQLPKSKLTPVAMGKQVFQRVETGSHQTVGFPEVITFTAPGPPTVFNASMEHTANQSSGRVPTPVLSSHVVLKC